MNILHRCAFTLGALSGLAVASGQATSSLIDVRAIAEVQIRDNGPERDNVHLSPANRVVPGDEVVYTLEIRDRGPDVLAPTIVRPVPDHMSYIADSATGPGAEVTFSIDGGHRFAPADTLKSLGTDGQMHVAKAMEYTHIRWQLKQTLKSQSVAYARFRAVVK